MVLKQPLSCILTNDIDRQYSAGNLNSFCYACLLTKSGQPQSPYNASKAGKRYSYKDIIDIAYVLFSLAVRHLASSLAVEWAKKGIRVNSLR